MSQLHFQLQISIISVRWESGIEIPAHDQDFNALKNVSHGNVVQVLLIRQAQILPAGLLFTLHPGTKKSHQKSILYYIFSMAGAKMKLPGATRGTPI